MNILYTKRGLFILSFKNQHFKFVLSPESMVKPEGGKQSKDCYCSYTINTRGSLSCHCL